MRVFLIAAAMLLYGSYPSSAAVLTYAISGTDQITDSSVVFCNGVGGQFCTVYHPGTFAGTLSYDQSTGTILSAEINAPSYFLPPNWALASPTTDTSIVLYNDPSNAQMFLTFNFSTLALVGGTSFPHCSGRSGCGPLIADMNGSAVIAAVPETSTWGMILIGFFGLGAASRWRFIRVGLGQALTDNVVRAGL